MKKGKTTKINGFRTSKVHYGTVDSKEFKSLYLNIQTWSEPKIESENWTRVVGNLSRDVKHSVYESLDRNLFNENFIVDLDLRTSGIRLEKHSFMNLEINLFTKEKLDFKGNRLKDSIKKILREVYKDCVMKNDYFVFSNSKETGEKKTNL